MGPVKPDGQQIRTAVLEAVLASNRGSQLQIVTVLGHVTNRFQGRLDHETEQAVLTVFYDLFRSGLLAWGYDISNPNPPFMHLTDMGRRALEHLSRDPMNQDGYMAFVRPLLQHEPVAESYIDEAIRTFQANCIKASAVMAGAAAESLVLGVRDAVVGRYVPPATASNKLTSWKVKTARDALTSEIEARKASLPVELFERFEGFWRSGSDAFRISRNEAGHPKVAEPVTPETVHGYLLLFPEFARLTTDLKAWIASSYIP